MQERTRRPPIDRFMEKVDKVESGCWLWTAYLYPNGYGRIWDGDTSRGAHRWSYEYFIGPIADGLTIDHLCRVRHCVNPAHLEAVTPGENVRRGIGFNARKDHCRQGHPFDQANTRYNKRGGRACRTCHRESEARRNRRSK